MRACAFFLAVARSTWTMIDNRRRRRRRIHVYTSFRDDNNLDFRIPRGLEE